VYRGSSADGPWERLTGDLIEGLGSSAVGRAYSWRDTGLVNGVRYYYRLEDVDTAGVSTVHGPVWAVAEASSSEPGEGEGEGGGTGSGGGGGTGEAAGCPSWVVSAAGPGIVECTRHGEPEAVSLEVVSLGSRGATLELRTGGFWAARETSGTVRVLVPGMDTASEATAPALPVRRALVDAVVGRKARLVSAQALELRAFRGLRPSAVGVAEVVVGADGTRRAGRRAVSAPRAVRGYLPQRVARLAGTVFQGESKSAVVELYPVRFDGYRQQLVLAQRVRVRVAFSGTEEGETGTGRMGRVRPRRLPASRDVLAVLHTTRRGVHGVPFEAVFPGRTRGYALSQLRLQREGEAVGYRVEPGGGEFGPGSRLVFWADVEASSTDHSGEVAWELVRAAGAGMETVSAAPAGEAAGTTSVGVARFETNRIYQDGLLEANDVWLWEGMGRGVARVVSLPLSGVDTSSARKARLDVELQGGTATGVSNEHHVRVSLRSAGASEWTDVAEASFAGKRPHRLSVDVAASVLVNGVNELRVWNLGDAGVVSTVFLDRVWVSYPQRSEARGGVFEGTWEEPGTVEVSGLGAGAGVLDVTQAAARWATGVEAGGERVRFHAEAGRRYAAVSASGLLAPRVTWPQRSSLREGTNQADYVLIAPRAFLEASEPLLVRRASQGLSTMGVSFEEIVEVFGHGRPSAEAIRAFLSHAYHSWRRPSPRYVLLLGDASFDPRGFQPTSRPAPLPMLRARTSYMWTASDPLMAAVNGDDLVPDLAIGRLPATTLDEARALVAKVLAWEDSGQDLSGRAVLVADDPDLAGDFEADVEDVKASFLRGRETQVLKLREIGAPAMKGAIKDAFDGGASLVSYVGHGGSAAWASENVWTSWDAPSLLAQSRQPLLVTMNCLNGYFIANSFDSLSESLVKAEGRGAVAAFSPSGLSLDHPAHQYHKALVAELTAADHARLGDAVLAAQAAYARSGLMPELLAVYHLLADPAMPIR
jgi:hypothetical protein